MAIKCFYSDSDTGTFADALKAVGLAEVLRAWLLHIELEAVPIVIEDEGSHYRIALPVSLDHSSVARVRHPFSAGRGKPLGKKTTDHTEKGALAVFPYDDERTRAATYFEQLKKLSDADRRRFAEHPEDFEDLRQLTPHRDLGLYVYVNHFKIADGYNALLDLWRGATVEAVRENLRLVLDTFATHPNRVDAAEERWNQLKKAGTVAGDARVSRLQVINPASGKGGNASKSNRLGIGNLDGFWLLEYLKFVGLFTIAAPLTVAGAKDRKTYVLQPVKAELGRLGSVMEAFRGRLYSTTAIKLDVMAALRFARTLVEHIRRALEAGERNDPFLALFDQAPSVTDIASGFSVAFYKDMGSAFATMNLATINLPGWLAAIASTAVADDALALLAEHERVISGIRSSKGDEGSDEIELLRRYRDFLSGQDVARFFDFAARYGAYYLAKRHRNQWAEQLTTDGMERLMAQASGKHPPYSTILANEGFREIAAAIRQATVRAQYRAARESGYPYEVRYGLGQDLLRAANYPDTFLAALGEFIQSYNAENARVDERIAKGSLRNDQRLRRASVRTDHIDEIVRLIDGYKDAELICKMLVAYGYARDPHTPAETEPAPVPAAMSPENGL